MWWTHYTYTGGSRCGGLTTHYIYTGGMCSRLSNISEAKASEILDNLRICLFGNTAIIASIRGSNILRHSS